MRYATVTISDKESDNPEYGEISVTVQYDGEQSESSLAHSVATLTPLLLTYFVNRLAEA